MNIIQSMIHEKLGEVRIIKCEDGNPMNTLFCATDVTKTLGYSNGRGAISRHCRCVVQKDMPHPQNIEKNLSVNFINLCDVLNLIQSAKSVNAETRQLFINWIIGELQLPNMLILDTRKETEFFNKLGQSLIGFGVSPGVPQYHVLQYTVDYYIPSLNVVIEYDENEHKSYNKDGEELREKEIIDHLKCAFIRVSDKNSDEYNIGYILYHLSLIAIKNSY